MVGIAKVVTEALSGDRFFCFSRSSENCRTLIRPSKASRNDRLSVEEAEEGEWASKRADGCLGEVGTELNMGRRVTCRADVASCDF